MTTDQIPDDLLRQMFERRADRARTADLRATILAATLAPPRRRRFAVAMPSWSGRGTTPRIIAIAIVSAALVGTAIGFGFGSQRTDPTPSHAAVAPSPPVSPARSATPRPTPTQDPVPEPTPPPPTPLSKGPGQTDEFSHHFTFINPAGSGLAVAPESAQLISFVSGSDDPFGRLPDSAFVAPGSRGITVSSFERAVTHPCPLTAREHRSRVEIRSEPVAFLEDLRSIGGIGIGPTTTTTLDGRSALLAPVDPAKSKCLTADIHLEDSQLTGDDFVPLLVPARLYVFTVANQTIVVHIWAATPDGLEAWLPTATDFVNSMHFTN